MEEHKIENIELKYLTVDDFEELNSATLESYGGVLDSFWKRDHIACRENAAIINLLQHKYYYW